MPTYYVETSALLKRYRGELGSPVMAELFENRKPGDEFITSHFTVLEVNSVAARWLKGRILRQRQYERFVALFLQDLHNSSIAVLQLDDALLREANGLLPEYTLRAPDALHFATAVIASRVMGNHTCHVVSADKEIGNACARYGLGILDPELPDALEHLRTLRWGV